MVVQDCNLSFSPLCFLWKANERGKVTATWGCEVWPIHHHATKNSTDFTWQSGSDTQLFLIFTALEQIAHKIEGSIHSSLWSQDGLKRVHQRRNTGKNSICQRYSNSHHSSDSPDPQCRWDWKHHPPGSGTTRSLTPCTPGYCWPRCSVLPGPDARSSCLQGSACRLQSPAAFPPAAAHWTALPSAAREEANTGSHDHRTRSQQGRLTISKATRWICEVREHTS